MSPGSEALLARGESPAAGDGGASIGKAPSPDEALLAPGAPAAADDEGPHVGENATGRVVFFDLETTGADDHDPRRFPAIQFAAVAVDVRTLAELDQLVASIKIYRGDEWQPDALAGNVFAQRTGWAPRWVAPAEVDQEHFAEAAARWNLLALGRREAFTLIDRFLRRHATVRMVGKKKKPFLVTRTGGHNIATFDLPRLRAMYGTGFFPCAFKCLDTYQLACWVAFFEHGAKEVELNLGALLRHHGIQREGEAHDALSDVRATVELCRRLMFRLTCFRRTGAAEKRP